MPNVLFFDRCDNPKDQDLRGRQLRGVLFGSPQNGVHVDFYDRAADFLGITGAESAVARSPYDAYVLHTDGRGYRDIADALILAAAERKAPIRVALLGSPSTLDGAVHEFGTLAQDFGVKCEVYLLETERNGYLSSDSLAAKARMGLRRMLGV